MGYKLSLARDANNNPVEIMATENPWEEWAGSGSANAPLKLGRNTIGFDGDGLMHKYASYNDSWTATTQTFDGFIGL